MADFWIFFLRKRAFSLLLIAGLVLGGLISMFTISKESAPEVQVPVGIVTTVLRGASALDVEKLITNKIEDAVINVEDVSEVTSSSRQGVSSVVVEFNADADIDESIDKLKDAVDIAATELPSLAEEPRVSDVNFADQPILLISVAGDLPATKFTELGEFLKDELSLIKGVQRVEVSGIQKREIQVIVNKEDLDKFGIRLVDVVSAIRNTNTSFPVGTITTNNIEYSINVDSDLTYADEIGDIALLDANGSPVFLRDIAFISDGIAKATSKSRLSINGAPAEQALALSIFKKRGGNILEVSDAVEEHLASLQETELSDVSVLTTFSSAKFVRDDLRNLSLSGLQTVILVMIVLLLTLGWREALIAGFAIPTSFLISFIGLIYSGNTINFISLFSLILSVGILVDSAIVVTEAIHTRMTDEAHREKAAEETLREFSWPLISGTMTTIAAFFPLFFISGVTGKFIASIPFTIIFVLSASLFVALGITPFIASRLLHSESHKSARTRLHVLQELYTKRLTQWYQNFLQLFLGDRKKENRFMRWLVISFFVTFTFPIVGLVEVIFFPQDNQDFVFIDLENPQGSVLAETDLDVRAIEEYLYEQDIIESFVTTIGGTSSFTSGSSGSKFGNITINLDPDREETSSEVVDRFRRDLQPITSIEVLVQQAANGPPTGKPIVVTFFGEDRAQLESAANRAEDILRTIDGTTQVNTSTKTDATELILSIDYAKASQAGLSSSLIAQTLQSAIGGSIATEIRNDDTDVDVVVTTNLNTNYLTPHDHANTNADAIRNLSISTPNGPVLLGSVVDITIGKSNAVIQHEDRERTTIVESDVQDGFNARAISAILNEKLSDEDFGDITYRVGGETEDVDESFRDMLLALIFGLLLMLAILVLQFNSFRYTFYILVIIPFTLIGVFVGLAITGRALSFPSIMGFITLAGIIVNNSIILIDAINTRRRAYPDASITDAVIDGSVSRLRPILLTTITTVVGIFPLVFASDIWGPLAYTVMFGLSFAVILTLILVPLLYNRWPGTLD